MVVKPTEDLRWATDDVQDPVSGQYNVIEPPMEKRRVGFLRLEYPPRQWFNYLYNAAGKWWEYFKYQDEKSRCTDDNTGTIPIADIVEGGICLVNVIDTDNPSLFFSGIAYIPPNPVAPIPVNEINSDTLTVSNISITGTLTVSGGAGPYIISGEMKRPPTPPTP